MRLLFGRKQGTQKTSNGWVVVVGFVMVGELATPKASHRTCGFFQGFSIAHVVWFGLGAQCRGWIMASRSRAPEVQD
jgi:hypothetical protein